MNYSLEDLLKAGVHFGHQVKRWHPKMRSYIYTQRNGVHIIDLEQTLKAMDVVEKFLEKELKAGKKVIFVGTKRQGKEIVEKEAKRCGSMYIVNRWPGGLVSNFNSISKTIKDYKEMLQKVENKEVENLTKKELSVFKKDLERKEKLIGGIKNLDKKPDILFILDVKRENNAVSEARNAGIPIIAVCDTNSNPELIDYPIPGNDDAVKSIQIFVSFIADLIEKNTKKEEKKIEKVEKIEKIEKKTEEVKEKVNFPKEEVKKESKKEVTKMTKLETLGITASLIKKLKVEGIKSVEDLKKMKEEELVKMKGFGASSVKKIKEALKSVK